MKVRSVTQVSFILCSHVSPQAKVMLLGAVLLGRSLEARQRLKAARGLQSLFDVRPDQVGNEKCRSNAISRTTI